MQKKSKSTTFLKNFIKKCVNSSLTHPKTPATIVAKQNSFSPKEYGKNRHSVFIKNKNTYPLGKVLNFVWHCYYITEKRKSQGVIFVYHETPTSQGKREVGVLYLLCCVIKIDLDVTGNFREGKSADAVPLFFGACVIDDRELVGVSKCIKSNAADAFGNGDACQVFATAERIISNGLNTIRQNYAGYRLAILECIGGNGDGAISHCVFISHVIIVVVPIKILSVNEVLADVHDIAGAIGVAIEARGSVEYVFADFNVFAGQGHGFEVSAITKCAVVNLDDAVRDGNACDRVASVKGVAVNMVHIRNNQICHRCAVYVKCGVFTERISPLVGELDIAPRFHAVCVYFSDFCAIVKSFFADFFDASGNIDGIQVFATRESVIVYFSNAFGQGDCGEIDTVFKCVLANVGDLIRDDNAQDISVAHKSAREDGGDGVAVDGVADDDLGVVTSADADDTGGDAVFVDDVGKAGRGLERGGIIGGAGVFVALLVFCTIVASCECSETSAEDQE